jgi:ribose transport system ATP-binding protein
VAIADELLVIRNMSKTFPGTRALDGVDFDVERAEVHALVGQNGSGKSTLIKCLAGYHAPDPGTTVMLKGEEIHLRDTAASRHAGFRFVHQDLGLVSTLSTVENLALGRGYATGFGGRIRWRQERKRAKEMIQDLGYSFDVGRPVIELAAAERTGVAIARALDHFEEAKLLVVDEPTATLPRSEVTILFEAILRVKERGLGVIYVSHRLEEIFALCDRVTILRDGKLAGTRRTSELDETKLVSIMLGGEELRPPGERHEVPDRQRILEVESLYGTSVNGVSLRGNGGEVLGIAGLTGSGRDEILSLIFGAVPREGDVRVDGDLVKADPAHSMNVGVALVPADRHRLGSAQTMTVRENCTMTDLSRHASKLGVVRRRAERAEVQKWVEDLDVRPPRSEATLGSLSGGNQQKVVMAKWLRLPPRVLLLDEPTQGVDIHAKAMIHELVRDVAGKGSAVIIASGDDNELADVCDHVLVMRDGAVVAEVHPEHLSADELGRLQLGGRPRSAGDTPAPPTAPS